MSIIETQEITRTYNMDKVPVYALRGINLKINKGEFTAIVGASGCGKTTLLNAIGGLDKPTSGKVIIDGTTITELSDKKMIQFRKNNIGFVFQAYNLIPVLTAAENAEFVLLLQHRNKEERQKRIKDLFDKIGIGEEMNKFPAEMSGGQQQRVAVARALASKPAFVLADEPTANLDSIATNELLDVMKQLNEQEGITFIFATHDQRVINKAKRVITLEDGKITKDEVQ